MGDSQSSWLLRMGSCCEHEQDVERCEASGAPAIDGEEIWTMDRHDRAIIWRWRMRIVAEVACIASVVASS